jgi:hypothetical protein
MILVTIQGFYAILRVHESISKQTTSKPAETEWERWARPKIRANQAILDEFAYYFRHPIPSYKHIFIFHGKW